MEDVFFVYIFTGKCCLQESQISQTSGKVLSKEGFAYLDEDQIREV